MLFTSCNLNDLTDLQNFDYLRLMVATEGTLSKCDCSSDTVLVLFYPLVGLRTTCVRLSTLLQN